MTELVSFLPEMPWWCHVALLLVILGRTWVWELLRCRTIRKITSASKPGTTVMVERSGKGRESLWISMEDATVQQPSRPPADSGEP